MASRIWMQWLGTTWTCGFCGWKMLEAQERWGCGENTWKYLWSINEYVPMFGGLLGYCKSMWIPISTDYVFYTIYIYVDTIIYPTILYTLSFCLWMFHLFFLAPNLWAKEGQIHKSLWPQLCQDIIAIAVENLKNCETGILHMRQAKGDEPLKGSRGHELEMV